MTWRSQEKDDEDEKDLLGDDDVVMQVDAAEKEKEDKNKERRGEKWKPLRPAAKDWEEAKEEFEKVEKFISEQKRTERQRSPVCKNCKRSGHEKDSCWLLHPEIASYWWEWRRAESSMERRKRIETENPYKGRRRVNLRL